MSKEDSIKTESIDRKNTTESQKLSVPNLFNFKKNEKSQEEERRPKSVVGVSKRKNKRYSPYKKEILTRSASEENQLEMKKNSEEFLYRTQQNWTEISESLNRTMENRCLDGEKTAYDIFLKKNSQPLYRVKCDESQNN